VGINYELHYQILIDIPVLFYSGTHEGLKQFFWTQLVLRWDYLPSHKAGVLTFLLVPNIHIMLAVGISATEVSTNPRLG